MAESPLLKLRQAAIRDANGSPDEILFGAIQEAEERWLLERELHKNQVRKIRKQRHEYIMELRTRLWLIAERLYLGPSDDTDAPDWLTPYDYVAPLFPWGEA